MEAQRAIDTISTHALTEGDISDDTYYEPQPISTHALTEGDRRMRQVIISFSYFNSRPHGGRRDCSS